MTYTLPHTEEIAEATARFHEAVAELMDATVSVMTVQIIFDNGKVLTITRDEDNCDVNEPLIQAAGEC